MNNISKPSLEDYFLEKLPEKINIEECLDLLFLVLDEKPGALIMSAESSKKKLIADFCDEFNLYMKVVEGEKKSFLDKLLRKDSRFIKDSIFLTDDKERFNILESSEGELFGSTDKAVGEFLGYPENAVNDYADNKNEEETAKMKTEGEIEKLLESGVLDEEELIYLEMISFLPRPKKENILDAIKTGKKRMDVLKQLDSELKTSIGQYYLTKISQDR